MNEPIYPPRRLGRRASSRRRSCFVGRGPPASAPTGCDNRRSTAVRSRSSLDSAVSWYRAAATRAEPRFSPSPRTTTVHRISPMRISTMSSARTSFAGFTRSPFSRTRPPRTASVAVVRVLKNRAAQSHLSMRMSSIATGMVSRPDRRETKEAQQRYSRCEVACARAVAVTPTVSFERFEPNLRVLWLIVRSSYSAEVVCSSVRESRQAFPFTPTPRLPLPAPPPTSPSPRASGSRSYSDPAGTP